MSFFDSTTSYVTDTLGMLFDRARGTGNEDSRPFDEIVQEVFAAKTEAQQLAAARALLVRYHHATNEERLEFFDHLLNDMDIDMEVLQDAIATYGENPDIIAFQNLSDVVEPKRKNLFRILGNLRDGAKCLVQIRQDLRRATRDNPDLKKVDHDLHTLLRAWFNRGFLTMMPVNWQSPAHILEKIIAYEAVHAIQDWDELRRRLLPEDRRCYAFFHPRMPDDPIIFVEVALTPEIPNSIDNVLAPDRDIQNANTQTTAVFYSISNCHAGLAGISFGNALIKQVATQLAQDLPNLKTFVTLSPVPGLSKWVEGSDIEFEHAETPGLAATYLCQATSPRGGPLDPVARFHLANGAQLHAIHNDANSSDEGLAQSYGVMVNYLYDLPKVNERSETFAETQKPIFGSKVKTLLSSHAKKLKKKST